jgi:hypothetical protein
LGLGLGLRLGFGVEVRVRVRVRVRVSSFISSKSNSPRMMRKSELKELEYEEYCTMSIPGQG